MAKDFVILVDNEDNDIGLMEKMEAHEKGVLHRAFSVFVFNSKKELMMQQRAYGKYHSPGLWTNTCCSHPRKGETVEQAAHRRLMEEMGFDCGLKKAFHFTYKADVGQGLIEHEFDHVLIAVTDTQPEINPLEVNNWRYISVEDLKQEMKQLPEQFTVWFKIAIQEVERRIDNILKS
jgi:isopentenyl-diphosphate Delta-isomerase